MRNSQILSRSESQTDARPTLAALRAAIGARRRAGLPAVRIYGLVTKDCGCNPNTVTANPTGGSRAIAIIFRAFFSLVRVPRLSIVQTRGNIAAHFAS